MIRENYPELKANQNFLALQDELAGTENRLQKETASMSLHENTINISGVSCDICRLVWL